jgi:hypothetical protein
LKILFGVICYAKEQKTAKPARLHGEQFREAERPARLHGEQFREAERPARSFQMYRL